jgi:hypothetical protein
MSERFKKVKIITFNYDRTLEHFLLNALQSVYGAPSNSVAEILSELKIFHPYGVVGDLPHMRRQYSVTFGEELTSTALVRVSSELRTFTEGTDPSSSEIALIRAAMRNSRRSVFLGFAYHPLNLKLLFGELEDRPLRTSHRVFGSAYGMSDSNIEAAANDIAILGRFHSDHVILRSDLMAGQLMNEYSRILSV